MDNMHKVAGVDLDGLGRQMSVKLRDFNEAISGLNKKGALRLLRILTEYPFDDSIDDLVGDIEKKVYSIGVDIQTLKSNMTLAYIAENSQKAAQMSQEDIETEKFVEEVKECIPPIEEVVAKEQDDEEPCEKKCDDCECKEE